MANDYIRVAPVFYSQFEAFMAFKDRNWRRVKREMNKAARRARWQQRKSRNTSSP
jgi:hypothetical protein